MRDDGDANGWHMMRAQTEMQGRMNTSRRRADRREAELSQSIGQRLDSP